MKPGVMIRSGSVDVAVDRTVVRRAHVDDPVVLDDQAPVAQDPVLAVLERDDPAGPVERRRHAADDDSRPRRIPAGRAGPLG